MSLNPLNELKRRLDQDSIALTKRLCLAKNVVASHHFQWSTSKERVVSDWLERLGKDNELTEQGLKDVIGWVGVMDDMTSELKGRLIQVVSQYLQRNQVQEENIECILSFLENTKICTQLTVQINDFLLISMTILKQLNGNSNTLLSQRILNNITKYYRVCKKKLEFIKKLLHGENLETIFSYLDSECRGTVVNLCQNILFPMNKKSFFVSFLQTLIRKDNIDDLIAEKGDNIQSVLKIMSAFFTFPENRTEKNQKFLSDFIDVFVSCFRTENQLIFAFYIMATDSLNMNQSYLTPAMKMPPIIFEENDEKIKRKLFLNMLETLLRNEIDINVRLTDTFGEKISKVEIKKNFTSFLQTIMLAQLKLEGKLDRTTLKIVKTALKLDPILIQQKFDQILPPIMAAKKSRSTIMDAYAETLNCLMEILFKLSRGTLFINQILPHIKLSLEAGNTEQFEIKQQIKEATVNGADCETLKSKFITGNDVFPANCVEMYGKLTSDLLFRQNKELLVSLQKDFEEHCLMMLEEGFVSPSIITLAEVLSAILSSFLRHNKMADHTVPRQIAEDFWDTYRTFEDECLRKFGECILKLSYDLPLITAFIRLCESFSQLKLLSTKYGNTELEAGTHTSLVFDLSPILPCLSAEQWTTLAGRISKDDVSILDNLLLIKIMSYNLTSNKQKQERNKEIQSTKTHLIEQLPKTTDVLATTNLHKVLLTDLDRTQLKSLAQSLVAMSMANPNLEILKTDAILNNRSLLNALVIETAVILNKSFKNTEDLAKMLKKKDFDSGCLKDLNVKEYFKQICLKDQDVLIPCIEIMKNIPIEYLDESYQLLYVLMLLISKNCCRNQIKCKKLRKTIDHMLQKLFEMSPKYPDIYKIFPVEFLFDFKDNSMLDLLTLQIKTSNEMLLIKSILECAVKKVKIDSEIIKNIVELLLTNQKRDISSIEHFSDPVFQISCIVLPIISKERKAITTSAYRSILATLQSNLLESMLKSFKNIDFSNSSLLQNKTGNTDESLVVSECALATLNAMGAYSLTLSKYCGTTDENEIKNMDFLWSGLDFFIQSALQAIQNPSSKQQHIDTSIQLLNVVLRNIKQLSSHTTFQEKDKVFLEIWKSIVSRLTIVFGRKTDGCLDDIALAVKFVCELSTVEGFGKKIVDDLSKLSDLKKPSQVSNEVSPSALTSHKVSRYLLTQCLKSNIVGPKCVALTKLVYKTCKTLLFWIQQNYETNQISSANRIGKKYLADEYLGDKIEKKLVKVEDEICEMLRVDLDMVSEAILAAKKISLDCKFVDSIFELQHLIHYIIGRNTMVLECEVSWQSYFKLFEGAIAILNSLLVSREELLEDRWPCFMQCYRSLVRCLCSRAASRMDRNEHDKLAESAHCIEKLTQSICKRKTHVFRIASYTVADMCSLLEQNAPSRMVRQHLENSIVLLIQASDSTYAVAFLRRALAGAPGHMTMTNLYTMYKRYHKYVGNA